MLGDSGDPLMLKEYVSGKERIFLAGMVSYGVGCGTPGTPG